MIHVGMGKKYIVDFRGRYRKRRIFKIVFSLLHSVIYQNVLTAGFKEVTASRNLVIRSDKCKLHM